MPGATLGAGALIRGPRDTDVQSMTRPTASVVVLAWNAWERTRACLDSVLPTLAPRDEVVVVDNASSDATPDGLEAFGRHPQVRLLRNEVNLGFAGGADQGASVASGEVLVFLNSDTLVTPGWLEVLLEPLADPRVGATGPRSNFVSGPQLLAGADYHPGDLGSQARLAAALAATPGPAVEEVERLVGFCLAVRARSFRDVGGFDIGFEGGGYEDDDLCRRLREDGWLLLVCHRAFVHHWGHASFEANAVDWAAAELANRDRFLSKHRLSPPVAAGPAGPGSAGVGGPEGPLVSLCMIVRDEADLLETCVESARGFVDQVVVYDTGSADDTVEVAARLGAQVLRGYWDDDFSRARNAALEACTGRWVLWLDADEVLSGDLATFRDRLAGEWDEVEGYVVRIENLHGSGLGARSVHSACRVFRRDVGHWMGRLHEQVLRRDRPEFPTMAKLADVHVVHRGYLDEIYRSRHKAERNLRLAEAEVAADAHDRPYALMNLGRSRMAAGRYEEALEALAEAAATTDNPTVRRTALRVEVDVLLALERPDEALRAAEELREITETAALADIAEGRCRIALGEVEEGLRLLASVTEAGADEDGFDYGPHTVAALRGGSLARLGRPGEAADLVLDVVRRFGVLDLHAGELAGWLLGAGRDPAEIAAAVPVSSLGGICGQCLQLPLPVADAILDALARRFTDALEPLAAAARVAPRLPVARALAWSGRLRRAGLAEHCPLLSIADDPAVEAIVGLRAASAAFGSFGDHRAVAPARRRLESLGGDPAALGEVARLAPRLAEVLVGRDAGAERVALNVGCGDDRRDGWINVDLRSDVSDVVADAGRLPFPDGAARELMALDLLEHFSTWDVPRILAEWSRVLAPYGRLVVRVPNLAALSRWLLEGVAPEEVIRNLYGAHRFGPSGEWDAHHSGWTPELLAGTLGRAGFRVVTNDGGLNMVAVAERLPTAVTGPAGDGRGARPAASIVIPALDQVAVTRRCLESLAGVEAGADFEVVVVDNGSTDATPELLETLGGDVTVVRNATNLGFARACNQGARLAHAPVVVLLNNDTEVRAGWLGALLGVLGCRPEVAAVGARLVYPDGRLQHRGIALRRDEQAGLLDGVLMADGPGAEPADVAAVSGACLAVRAEALAAVGGLDEGYWNGNEDVDLCLALRAVGWVVAYEPSAVVVHHESASGPERWSRLSANRIRLTDRWDHRLGRGNPVLPRPVAGSGEGVPEASGPPSREAAVPRAPGSPRRAPLRGGLNVVGFLDASLGLGQVARSMVGAALAAGVEVSTWSSRGHWSLEAASSAPRGEPFEWDTSLVIVNPDSYLNVVEEAGLDAFRDRYLIGMWFWELEEPSPEMASAATTVHEIWVASEFVAAAVRRVTERPVRVVPVPVPTADAGGATRADIAMPPGFVIAHTFDFNSQVQRKNPQGVVEAFTRAFRSGEGPRLYLKSMNGGRLFPRQLAELSAMVADRPDVVLVDEVFDAVRAAAIAGLADVYVSLHRSEGLGLAIAEAMAAGTPVVATGYSGNLELMHDANSYLVPYRLGKVPPGTPPYPAGATWAEPDVDEAARILRRIWEDPADAHRRAELARAEILATRSPEAAGAAIRARLEEITRLRYGAPVAAGG